MSQSSGKINSSSIIIAFLVIIFFLVGPIVRIYTDWLWFLEVGYGSVYSTILSQKVLLGFLCGILFVVVTFVNMALAKKYLYKHKGVMPSSATNSMVSAAVVFLGVIYGLGASSGWNTVLLFQNRVLFGITDPIFSHDIAFYVFNIPLYTFILGLINGAIVLNLILLGVYYATQAGLFSTVPRKDGLFDENFKPGEIRIDSIPDFVVSHMTFLAGIFLVLMSIKSLLGRYDILYSSGGVVFGAGYTDVVAKLPFITLFAATLMVLAVFVLLYSVGLKSAGKLAAVMGIICMLVLFAGTVYPSLVQQYKVSPNELRLETPYIENNIKYTLSAYDLNDITQESYPVNYNLSMQDIEENSRTIDNIRLWDWGPLGSTYAQLQGIRPYYVFNDVDIDRYEINGELQQVSLSARELSHNKMQTRARTWQNEHLVYTHGYGVVVSPVNDITDTGLPEFYVKDIPPKAIAGIDIVVDRPEIYFGEVEDTAYSIVRTKSQEFDYPSGDENKYTTYTGNGGIELSGLNKLLFSSKFGTLKMLLSSDISSDSRIMFNRNIYDRVRTIAPFLTYDSDPYVVISDGKLYWMYDAYTVTNRYPYSEPYGSRGGFNYIRNSVKVVIDAYNGDVTFYAIDTSDPLFMAYSKTFPELFRPLSEMSEDLQTHIRYPEDLFMIQAEMFSTYHMQDVTVFYNKEDVWNIPNEIYDQKPRSMNPYYVLMPLTDGGEQEFMTIIPFTPPNKDNIIAWMSIRSDAPNYGQKLLYKFSKQELVYGPMQIESRVDQDAAISQELTLWGQKGSRVIRGSLLVIPIKGSILYVEPLYIEAEQSRLPELKRVIVSYDGRIAMEKDLDTALRVLFEGRAAADAENAADAAVAGGVGTGGIRTITELSGDAMRYYNQAQEMAADGNWAGYGIALDNLERTLGLLADLTGVQDEDMIGNTNGNSTNGNNTNST